eukprot:341651-Alexandrium_andersonii.AAC.1
MERRGCTWMPFGPLRAGTSATILHPVPRDHGRRRSSSCEGPHGDAWARSKRPEIGEGPSSLCRLCKCEW